MSEEHIRALSAAVPARYRQARWALLYSTARDGISLQTLLRNAAKKAPTVLVVRDFERWAVRPRVLLWAPAGESGGVAAGLLVVRDLVGGRQLGCRCGHWCWWGGCLWGAPLCLGLAAKLAWRRHAQVALPARLQGRRASV